MSERNEELTHLAYVDLNDRRRPKRSGRYVPLEQIRAVAEALRTEPDGLEQLCRVLEKIALDKR